MKLKVLGCSGGIGGDLRTTSFLLDDDILLDAGTGVGDLSIDAMSAIDHIFLTHSHLDHVTSVPFLVDTVIGLRDKYVTLHATRETWQALKEHIFNWKIWPDFTVLPTAAAPFLRYSEIKVGETVVLGSRQLTPLPVSHSVPAVGFRLDSGAASLVFSGDMTSSDVFWQEVNKIENLKYVIVETSFSDTEMGLAKTSKHLCPSLLLEELRKLERPAQIYITHLKPGEGDAIMHAIAQVAAAFSPVALHNQQLFEF